jgi:hypothetical protein
MSPNNSYISKFIPQPPWNGLPLPQGLKLTWPQMADTLGDYVRDVRKVIGPSDKPRVLPDVVYLAYKSISIAAISSMKKDPVLLNNWAARLQKMSEAEEQLTKMEVAYLDLNPPPVFWDYKCFKCRFFVPYSQCTLVGGTISIEGWCVCWLPPDEYKRGAWRKELIKGKW